MFWAYLLITLPLAIYLLLFSFETLASFRLLGGKNKKLYPGLGWEVTHTLLVMSFTFFVWLCSPAAFELSHAVYWALITIGAIFILRIILYLILFNMTSVKLPKLRVFNWLFALSNLTILLGIVYIAIRGFKIVENSKPAINFAFLPTLWIGFGILALSAVLPLAYLYSKRR